MDIQVGAIVLLPFPFTDLSNAKVRPSLVISDLNKETVIVVFLSSKISSCTDQTDFVISKNASYFEQLGLKKDSVVKCEKIMTLSKSLILGELGHLPDEIFKNEIKPRLKIALKLD